MNHCESSKVLDFNEGTSRTRMALKLQNTSGIDIGVNGITQM